MLKDMHQAINFGIMYNTKNLRHKDAMYSKGNIVVNIVKTLYGGRW